MDRSTGFGNAGRRDMTQSEAAMSASVDDETIARRMIRLNELAIGMFGAIADHFYELPDAVIDAAEDWYSYLVESAEDL